MTPKILRQDAKLWEQWIYTFIGVNKLATILPFIPFKDIQLNKAVYEMVLSRFLETDQKMFLELVKKWPHELYNVATVADGVEALLVKEESKFLLEAAVDLCRNAKRFDRALIYGLKLRVPTILTLVIPHNLFQTLQLNARLLMEYDMDMALHDEDIHGSRMWTGKEEGFGNSDRLVDENVRVLRRSGLQQGVSLLVENTDRAPVSSVVKELGKSRQFLHVYLDALFRFDEHEGLQYHTDQVELYADFDPTRLLDFLRSSAMYKIQAAYELCELRDLVPEMVYLLGKMGNNRKALVLVIERLGDVKQAIDFAKEQNDDELWDDLIKYSMDKPPFIIGLLENLGSHVDPIKLIQNIPEGLPISNLQASLIKIMTDYGIQMSLREGCGKILVSDAVTLMENLYFSQRNGISFNGEFLSLFNSAEYKTDQELQCNLCDNKFAFDDKHIVFFFCRHTYHKSCLLSKSVAMGRSITDSPMHTLNRQSSLTPVENPISTQMERTLSEIYTTHHDDGILGGVAVRRLDSIGLAAGPGGLAGVIGTVPPKVEVLDGVVGTVETAMSGLDKLMQVRDVVSLDEDEERDGRSVCAVCPLCRA
ncbi:UNVERIFIED_CONTAM: Vacuolar protein sorting-associated protein 41 [Siphonaria sp. JEL0065]|nr:Vacuolar protein sorting-associated protein 41 [Siphonaria sp. JEL0065]